MSMEGCNLRDIGKQTPGRLSFNNLMRVAYTLGNTLCYIHDRGFIHRDLKADNVVVTFSNEVCTLKLIDFGKAIRIKDQNGNQLPGHQDGIDYSRCSQHSVNVILGIAPTQNDDWSSLVYLLMKMRGFSWGDTAEEMLDLKVQFENDPKDMIAQDMMWMRQIYRNAVNEDMGRENNRGIVDKLVQAHEHFDFQSMIEYIIVDGHVLLE
ncbi:non-specific serine/threonine protein kinase [Caenorhabditis elegans]|uniref:non-specific serine/threonine protein kinase n=1 Tax=Caenorhabditis elegans TaxID=6239 RepID=Q94193_CAEEL|nr:Protein kinase domain-containing protein [Caenorhabditis elegans]CCD69879.1 Protein kinase domain-containing protein [Caenorhabditis elegans]|eukprot:NP_510698.2 Uncharacterized protein CELE_F22H10.1 [Caenorhabditis elegans]